MKRTAKKVVTYTATRAEVQEALLGNLKDSNNMTLLPDPKEIRGLPERIEFVYEYDETEPHPTKSAGEE